MTQEHSSDPRVADVDSPSQALEQQQATDWPKPGDEGYVHPDGTPHSQRQLADNRRAAADRAAAGSTIHGAPAATPGPQVADEAQAAVRRAEAHSGPSDVDARRGQTAFIREGLEQAAQDAEPADARPAREAKTRTVTSDQGKTSR